MGSASVCGYKSARRLLRCIFMMICAKQIHSSFQTQRQVLHHIGILHHKSDYRSASTLLTIHVLIGLGRRKMTFAPLIAKHKNK
jgi:hypothetical protein